MPLRELLSRSVDSGSPAGGGSRFPNLQRRLQSLLDAERELWFLVTASMLVDVTLTVHGLHLGLRELNPVARRVMAIAGVPGLYGLKGLALGVGLCCRPLVPDRANVMIPLLLALPSLFAVGINAVLLTTLHL